ncbi:transcription termination/antitermination protein NusG [Planctomycetota bacterium]
MKKWYAIRVLSNKEEEIKKNIELMIEEEPEEIQELFGEILVPTEKVAELKEGRKKVKEKRLYPGYLMVEMEMTDDTWTLISDVEGVSGFVSADPKNPEPLGPDEIIRIKQIMEDSQSEEGVIKVDFDIGDTIRVKEGAFADYEAIVKEVLPNKGKVNVSMNIFGRSTVVELELWQVEKV